MQDVSVLPNVWESLCLRKHIPTREPQNALYGTDVGGFSEKLLSRSNFG